MNIKINTICFIFLLFLLIGVASAADADNETLKQTDDSAICQMTNENPDTLKLSNQNNDKLEMSANNAKLESNEKVLSSLTTSSTKEKVTIKAPKVKMRYNDGSKFTLTLKDKSKKAIKNAKVKITIGLESHTKKTNSKGKISLKLKLDVGKYDVYMKYSGSKKHRALIEKSTITVKTTIQSHSLTKYYTNNAAYSCKFYDKMGKLLKNREVKIKLDDKTYSLKTDTRGVAKLDVDLKPGVYMVSATNPATSQTASNLITVKSLIETGDLTMTEKDGSKFSVKVLNNNGKASSNKKVTLKVNGKVYTPTSNSNGIATQTIDLPMGKYTIITEYGDLICTNMITVNKNPQLNTEEPVKKTPFSHITSIPNYVNVTTPYVFQNTAYTIKSGFDGIIRMPKNEIFTVQINETQSYLFSQASIPGIDSTVIGYKTHLVPFDGSGVKSDYNKENLKGDGILISSSTNYTHIEYRSTTEKNTELFGLYMEQDFQNSERITYIQNDKIKAMVNFYTYNYDELGLKYSLGKYYGKTIYDFDYASYDEITRNEADKIKFAKTGEPVTFSYFGKSIVGYLSKEDLITKLIVDGVEELEKSETISYGLDEKYRKTMGFEVLQGYAIINKKVTRNTLEKEIEANVGHLSKFGAMNVYGMYLASLETAWLADEIADSYAKEFNVEWFRENTTTILGGINLKDTYLNILNADMGMKVTGDGDNITIFKLVNSINLPNIEDYVFEPVAKRFWDNTTNSLHNVLGSISANNFSFTQFGEMMYIFSGNDTAIALNTSSGVANVILSHDNAIYKGSSIPTTQDCCGVGIMPKDIIKGIRDTIQILSPISYLLSDHFDKFHGFTRMAYYALKPLLAATLKGASGVMFGLLTTMTTIQTAGSAYKDTMVDEEKWHSVMDHVTFTRPGYLQGKKVYNIPNKKGGNDYIEVKINDDMTLDRNNAVYISEGQTKKLTKQETYKYFCEDYWTPFSMPTKYWDKSWKGG